MDLEQAGLNPVTGVPNGEIQTQRITEKRKVCDDRDRN